MIFDECHKTKNFKSINSFINKLVSKRFCIGDGDWGLGIGDWPNPHPQSP
jgi:hypothetical protein